VSDPRTALRAEIERASAELTEAGVASPLPDALALAAHALGVPRLVLAVPPPLPAAFHDQFRALVRRRAAREPLQHLLGQTAFRHVLVRVEPGVFVPRPETEVVAGAAIAEAQRIAATRSVVVVDLCTGTGAIAAAVAAEVPGARVVAVDVSPAAVRLAGANLTAAGGGAARVVSGSVAEPALLAELTGGVDVVVSNPPYIPPDGVPVDPEVRLHDPPLALYGGGADGLAVPRQVIETAARLLRTAGLLVMEHGDRQGEQVRAAVAGVGGFAEIRTHRDLTHRDRYVTARRRTRPTPPRPAEYR
jgi:release factor glutamine methyltransferase